VGLVAAVAAAGTSTQATLAWTTPKKTKSVTLTRSGKKNIVLIENKSCIQFNRNGKEVTIAKIIGFRSLQVNGVRTPGGVFFLPWRKDDHCWAPIFIFKREIKVSDYDSIELLDECPIQIGRINNDATESATLEWTVPGKKTYVTLKNQYGTFVIWDKFMTAKTTDMSKIIQIKSNGENETAAIDAQQITGSLVTPELYSYKSYPDLDYNSITDVKIIKSV